MDIQLLNKYNKPGPRYTSYPPATFFQPGFSVDEFKNQLVQSNNHEPQKISLYIHIPFCPQLCHFCGCNTSKMKDDDFVKRYVRAIRKEIQAVAGLLDTKRIVSQVHWGGGTPNSIPLEYVKQVMVDIHSIFTLDENAEIAMECNPAYLELEHINSLAHMGFNRLSLGIQDFNVDVLNCVNRLPSKHPVKLLVDKMKSSGMKGVNIDLIYGLPGQTPQSFRETIQQAIDISPDRLVTFSYAHVPWVKSDQKHLEELGIPSSDQKLEMFEIAYKLLTQNGYRSIGMDHYAKPEDELCLALSNKTLHRNFQGYCTRETTGQVHGFGATSISQLHGAYIQNNKNINFYVQAIEELGLAPDKGYVLTQENIIVRQVINELMCNGYLDFNEIGKKFQLPIDKIKAITSFSMEKLHNFIEDKLLSIQRDTIKLNPEGFFVVRNIAMEFDPLLDEKKGKYSKTI